MTLWCCEQAVSLFSCLDIEPAGEQSPRQNSGILEASQHSLGVCATVHGKGLNYTSIYEIIFVIYRTFHVRKYLKLTVVNLHKKIFSNTFFHCNCNHCSQKQDLKNFHFDWSLGLSLKLVLAWFDCKCLWILFIDDWYQFLKLRTFYISHPSYVYKQFLYKN